MSDTCLAALIVSAVLATTSAIAPALADRAAAPPQAADKAHGMAMMSAVIDSDGTLREPAGALGVDLQAGSKIYIVTFARPLAGCVSMASPLSPGVFTATSVNRSANTVHVGFLSAAGSSTQSAFELFVFCPR